MHACAPKELKSCRLGPTSWVLELKESRVVGERVITACPQSFPDANGSGSGVQKSRSGILELQN